MTVKEIYEQMSASGLASSQMEFSCIWLGRSPRYYSHLIAKRREPGVATLSALIWRLDALLARTPCEDGRLLELKQQLVELVQRRVITDRRKPQRRRDG